MQDSQGSKSDRSIPIHQRALPAFQDLPFILGATLAVHLGSCKTYPTEFDKMQRNMYLDEVILGGNNIPELEQLQAAMTKIFG